MKNIIGIDYGERYIGLAIKKKNLNTPYPSKILDNKKVDILIEIKKLLDDNMIEEIVIGYPIGCLLYTSPSPRDRTRCRMPSSA